MTDPIIDRSAAQKHIRVEKLRAELLSLNYELVPLGSKRAEFWRRMLERVEEKTE